MAAANPAVSGPMVCPIDAYDWLTPNTLPCSDLSILSAMMALSMGLRKPLNSPYTQRQTANSTKTVKNPDINIAAKHNKVDNSRITDFDGKIFVKTGTHNWAMMPHTPNADRKIPIVAGVIFNISLLKI